MDPRPARLVAAALALGTALISTAAVAGPGLPSARSAPTVTLGPGGPPQGEGPGVPLVIGTTILDGDLRIEVSAQEVQLLGTSDGDYVSVVYPRSGRGRVERIAPDGTRETVARRITGDVVLSADGRRLFETSIGDGPRSVVTVRDASTGDRLARRTFRGYARVLDAAGDRAVLGSSSPSRTFWWRTRSDETRRIAAREGYFADIGADRVAGFTGNPLDGGCSVVSALSAPAGSLWRSCEQAVVAASPDGRRLLTQGVYSDGPVGRLSVHRSGGRLLASYETRGYFGPATWESDREVLVTTYGAGRAAIVRCRLDACERAGAPRPAP